MPVSRSRSYEVKRWLVLALASVTVLAAVNVGLYQFAQYSVKQELAGVATTLSQRVTSVLAESGVLADDVHKRWQNRASQTESCDSGFADQLGKQADLRPYVKGVSILKGQALLCTSLPGTAQAQIDGMLTRLMIGNGLQPGSPLNLDSPGLLTLYPYADGYNVLSILPVEYFFDLLSTLDPKRYGLVVLRINGTYLRSDRRAETHLPKFGNDWTSASAPGSVQIYVEASDDLWWRYIRDSVVTWNVIAIGALWLVFGFSRRFTSQDRAFTRALRKAVASNAIVPYYQPVFDLPDQTLAGVEILARWQLPDGRFVSPERFIAQAEANGLIADLTRSLMTQVIADLPLLDLPPAARMALNLPHESLGDDVLFACIENWAKVLQQHGLQPVIEVTERGFVAMSQTEKVNTLFGRLRERGIQIALDDFGAEYSSLGYLHRFRFDYVKIDGLFLDGVGKSREVESVLDAVLDVAAKLDLKVVVEKVETPVQLSYLNRRKVNAAQGYYFGRPVAAGAWQSYARRCAVCRHDCRLSMTECEQRFTVNGLVFSSVRAD
ncbi:diguanylate phosphodiesterase [Jeongeupia sp. HS-3]|uniref:EAL domain-containing protein n=1 Tax=Jeongeupia sp. HS-3 TaxID=1009682 RepID=UPI0018A4AF41|nr:EAL domain-containing protein [Jeongeupia sp. HS-3]BCL74869.1 diguanylate phosphodiesterase [Jeongeupia sp. HS-3]